MNSITLNRSTVTDEWCWLRYALVISLVFIFCILKAVGEFGWIHFSTFFLLLSAASFLVVKGRGPVDVLHPVRILGTLWCFCLALASMRLLPLISEWDFFMWACSITALAAFVGGFWFSQRKIRSAKSHQESPASEQNKSAYHLPLKKTLKLAILCVLIGVCVLSYEFSLIGTVPILAENVDAARMELFSPAVANPEFNTPFVKFIHLFVEFTKYGVFLALILLLQRRTNSWKEVFLCLAIILIGTLAYVSQGGRQFVLDLAVTSVVFFHYLRRRIRLWEFVSFGAILVLFVGIVGSSRIKQSSSAPLFQKGLSTSEFPEGDIWDGMAFGYATMTSSLEVFYRLTLDLRASPQDSGGYLFYAFHRFIPRSNLGDVALDLYSGELVTATFMGEFYGDYGYWGVLIGPLVLGLAYGWAYAKRIKKSGIYWVYVRALLLKNLIFFAYVNLFSQYVTWIFDLVLMYLLLRYAAQQTDDAVI